jgi:hypothetical protein
MKRCTAYALAGLLLSATSALAEPKQEAKEHFAKGQAAYQKDDYAQAVEEFTAAYALDPAPVYLYNAAVAYELWGKKDKAAEFYAKYYPFAPKGKEKLDLEAKIIALGGKVPSDPEAKPGANRIKIDSQPSGAEVWLEEKKGQAAGKTPLEVEIEPGKHALIFVLPGYVVSTRSVEVSRDKALTEFTAELVKDPSSKGGESAPSPADKGGEPAAPVAGAVTVSIQTNIVGAQVFLDDKARGVAGLTPYQASLTPGEHTLIIEKEGYEPLSHKLSVSAEGASQVVSLELQRSTYGRLRVKSNQRGAQVYVDDEKVGVAPFEGELPKVKVGTHKVRVVSPGFSPWEGEIDVEPGATIRVETELAKKPSKAGALIALAISGGFAASGVVLGGQATSIFNSVQDDLDAGLPVDDNDPRFQDGRFRGIAADVSFGLAGVSALVGVTRFFVKGNASKGEVKDSISQKFTPSSGALVLVEGVQP